MIYTELKINDLKGAASNMTAVRVEITNGAYFNVWVEPTDDGKIYHVMASCGDSVATCHNIGDVRAYFKSIDVANDTDESNGRTFIYSRVSTVDQTTDNQKLELKQRGYVVPDNRFISEVVSGGVMAMERKEFSNLMNNKIEQGDTLVVLKLDRIGRNSIDVQQTVNLCASKGIKLICLDLPVSDLSSAEGKLMLQMMAAYAEFEKTRLIERTKEGLNRAKAEGKKLGRPDAWQTRQKVQECKSEQKSQSQTAKHLDLGIATVKRHWNIKG